jgi:hypothetical protein
MKNIGEENQAIDSSVPVVRLDLEAFKPELLEQAEALNEDFLTVRSCASRIIVELKCIDWTISCCTRR